MKKVILISGKINCGKNQFADYLTKELQAKGLKVDHDLFARSLKDGCKEDFRKLTSVLKDIASEIKAKVGVFVDNREIMLNPSVMTNIENSIDKLLIEDKNWYEDKTDITRNILQLYGTEIFRKRVDEEWWVKQLRNRAIKSESDAIIVTDARFPNEIIGISDDNFNVHYETLAIRIERNINTQEQIAAHDSETALDNWNEWNYVVENNGTLENLKASAAVISQWITEKTEEKIDGLFTRQSKETIKWERSLIS